jgi:hypothetical protein
VDITDVREYLGDLPALQSADEVPDELRMCGRLDHKVLRPILACERDPAGRQRRQLALRQVLDSRQNLHLPRGAARSEQPLLHHS